VGTLHLVLAESALELVPEELWSHPAVAKSARARNKRPGELLLEDTFHHSAMRAAAKKNQFPGLERRGRPDIIHLCLLVALESRLNHEGSLRCWVHTRNDETIEVDPEIRLQRAQHRFNGLMEQLLLQGEVPPGAEKPLLRVHSETSLADAVKRTGARQIVLFDENGEDENVLDESLTADGQDQDLAVLIGGFPTGPLTSDLSGLSHKTIRLGSRPLTAWTVASEILVRYHQAARR
jgi:rRNA small subunit pseudouridine methyltransferase Nep1